MHAEQRHDLFSQLPLDYSFPHGRQAGVTLVRLPASDLDNYRGPILINPGETTLRFIRAVNGLHHVTQAALEGPASISSSP